jgi:hypothetical protein
MADESEVTLTVEEFVEYCQTQAGLLWGQMQTMNDDVLALLDEIDTEVPEGSGDLDVADLEARQEEIRQKQERVETDQARIRRMKDLAGEYERLAADLASDAADGQVALSRVLRFEVEHDVPEYFTDRTTMVEVAADARGGDLEGDSIAGEPDDGDDD